jgi:hypothetical protein
MVWFLRVWAGYIPSALALILGIAFERYARRQVRWLQLTLVCMCCVVILGGGALLQSILGDAFFSGTMATGLVYKLEFTSYLASTAMGLIVSGLQCGPLLAVLLVNTRAKKTAINAATAGVFVLLSQDIWSSANIVITEIYHYYHGIAASYPALWHPRMALSLYANRAGNDLKFSGICDVIGGPFAGILCRWLFLEVKNICVMPDRWRVLAQILGRSVIGIFGAVGALASVYFIFVKPVRQDTVLTVTKEHLSMIQYGIPNLPIPYFLTFPTNGLLIHEPSNRMVTFASSEPLLGHIVAIRNCKTAGDAAGAAQASPEDLALGVFDLRGKTIGIDQGIGSISIVPSVGHNEKAILSLNNDAQVNFSLQPDNRGRSIVPIGPNTLSIPITSGTAIVISTLNVKGASSAVIEGHKPTIALAFKAPGEKDGENCHALSFSDSPRTENYKSGVAGLVSDGIVIRIVDAKPSSEATLTVSGSLETPEDVGPVTRNLLTKPASIIASYLVFDADEGSLSVGIDQIPIGPNHRVVLAGVITLAENDSGAVVATGDLPYVGVNGTLITKALFWHLSSEMQVAVVSGIAVLLGTLLRRVWPQIARRLQLF